MSTQVKLVLLISAIIAVLWLAEVAIVALFTKMERKLDNRRGFSVEPKQDDKLKAEQSNQEQS